MRTLRNTAARLGVAGIAAVFACGGTYGFAASFGAGGGGLGANAKVLTACGSGLIFGYTTEFDPSISGYAVSGIELSDIPAGCLDKQVSVTFEADGVIAGSEITFTLPGSGTAERIAIAPAANTIAAEHVSGISVVVL